MCVIYVPVCIFSEMKGITVKLEYLSIGNRAKMVGFRPQKEAVWQIWLWSHVNMLHVIKQNEMLKAFQNECVMQTLSPSSPFTISRLSTHGFCPISGGLIPGVHGAHAIISADSAVELPNAVTLRLSANRSRWLMVSISKYLYRSWGDSFLLQMVNSPHAFSPSHFKTYISSLACTFSDRKLCRDHFAVNQCWRRSS